MKKRDKRHQITAPAKRAAEKPARPAGATSVLNHIYHAREYPFEDCWVQRGWDNGNSASGLAVVVVARRQSDGNILYGTYLVDHYCLGLKDTLCDGNTAPDQFHHQMLPKLIGPAGEPMSISVELAHEIVYGAIEYAKRWGFRPHRDFELSQRILDPADAHPRSGEVTFGRNGKPFYISGPYDDVDAIVRKLERTAGPGNFDFLRIMGAPFEDDFD